MKKLIILSLILAAGLTAYPQSSRSSREAKSNKSRSSQVASRSSSKSSSRQVKSSSSNKSRSQATKAKSAVSRSGSSRSSAPKAVSSRSSSSQSRSNAVKSGNSGSRSNNAVRSGNSSSRSSGAVSSGNSSSRSSSAVKSGNSASRSTRNTVGNSSASRSGQAASRSGSEQRSSRSAVKSNSNNVLQSSNSRSSVPSKVTNSERGKAEQNAVKSRMQNSSNVATRSSNSSDSFNRSNRQGSKAYVSRDGREFRHQNDEVFSRVRYRTDYRDVNSLRNSRDFIRVHNHYYNWYNHRHIRRVVVHNHFYRPMGLEIRRVRYPYRVPVHLDLCWTPHLHHSFVYYYPLHNDWNHVSYGDYIETTSSYEAMNHVGTVKRVYGKVEEVFYSPEDKTYTLYFGAPFPYHDFSVVVPRDVAKSFSWSPSWYFEDEHVWAVGLIEMWEGKPEIVLHDEQQIRRY